MPGASENVEVALESKVPVINFSLGKGDSIVQRAHAYGGKVIATVVNEKVQPKPSDARSDTRCSEWIAYAREMLWNFARARQRKLLKCNALFAHHRIPSLA